MLSRVWRILRLGISNIIMPKKLLITGFIGSAASFRRNLFRGLIGAAGVKLIDLIRANIWKNELVNVIYKQNMLLYVRKTTYKELKLEADIVSKKFDLDRIHPELLRMRTRDRMVDRRTNFIKGLKYITKSFGFKR